MFPSFQEGQVIAVNAKRRRLTVQCSSGQIVEVRTLYHGPADAVRVSHKSLPNRGTYGLVAFPYGDDRAGYWLGSSYPMFMDALTTDDDPFMEYDSHWSGAYETMDQQGRWTKSFPDGTFIQVSDSASKPTMYRHTVDQTQAQQLTMFPDSERVPNAPSPRYVVISHPTGASIEIDTGGNVTVTAANGHQVQANANGGSITIDKNGGIEANAASGQNMKLSAGGAATSYTLVRTDLLVQWLANHTHIYNGSETQKPSQSITNTTIQSNIADVSE